MPTVLLDGQWVEADKIDPAVHRFLGTFREPRPPQVMANHLCPCGLILRSTEETRSHWAYGHFDVPQYVSMEPAERGR